MGGKILRMPVLWCDFFSNVRENTLLQSHKYLNFGFTPAKSGLKAKIETCKNAIFLFLHQIIGF